MKTTRRTKAAWRNYIAKHVDGDKKKYCTGCGHLFDKTHEMLNHRYTFRCGGQFRIAMETELSFGFPVTRPRLFDDPSIHINHKMKSPKHLARVLGTIRSSRMPGGCGYRGNKMWEMGNATALSTL